MNNNIVCKNEDENGYCVFAEGTKYDMTMDCYFGKFRIDGNRSMNTIEKIAYIPQKIIYYPVLQCWNIK